MCDKNTLIDWRKADYVNLRQYHNGDIAGKQYYGIAMVNI